MQKTANTKKNWIKKIGIAAFWIVLWQLVALGIDNSILFASPAETLLALWREMVTLTFWQTLAVSMARIALGFMLALLVGSLLGGMAYQFSLFREVLSPVMLFCKAVPVASFAVLLLIWWGAEWISFAICFLVALPMVYVNILEGLFHADKKLLEMVEVFGIGKRGRFFAVYRPALAPFLEGCFQTALGMGIKAGVAAEVIGISGFSIGGELYQSKIYLDTAGVAAWTAVIIALSFFSEKLLVYLWRAFLKWKPLPKEPAGRKHAKEGSISVVLKKVRKSYGNKKVLAELSKELLAGNTYCLMAPSGTGKTTLLHILAGILQPEEGEIYGTLDGRKMQGKLSVGMVFQDDRLCEEETALWNVALVCGSQKKAKQLLEELLGKEIWYKPVKSLSGGMRRRVCIARALAAEADCLILDEPFSGLDEESREKAAKVICAHKKDRLLLVATHEEKDAKRLQGEIWKQESFT